MFKFVIAVALLSYVALGDKINPFDRQDNIYDNSNTEYWDADKQAFCVDDCKDYCNNCTEPVYCDETQKFCGKKPIDPQMHLCSPDDICVPAECECDYLDYNGDSCERLCQVECSEDQVLCDVKETQTGCKQNGICIHKGFSHDGVNLCNGFCPIECEEVELFCPVEPLPDGCKQAEDCIPKQKDHQSNICPQQQCPIECTITRHLCVGTVDEYGCKENDVCVLKQTSNTGEVCPGTCPVECVDGEILCSGQTDYSDTPKQGCEGQDICHVKAKDDNLVFCPPDSASHLCPKTCPPTEILCEPGTEPLGCKGPYVCATRSVNDMDEYCPSTADCPEHCATDEYNCPTGDDENGCKLPDSCEKKERGLDGELCPFHCPELCTETQVFCEGGIDETGCRVASSCRDKQEHRWGPGAATEPKEECPGSCPNVCESHEILCPSQLDPCNGCPTEQVCREAIKGHNGIMCAGKEVSGQDVQDDALRKGGYISFSHNCPKLCKEQLGEVLCPTYENENGCKPAAECMMRTCKPNFSCEFAGTDQFAGDWCSSHSVCPKQCPKGFLLCEYETVDVEGCKVEPSCVYKGKNNDDLYCGGHCPPICSGAESLVSPGYENNGCELPSVCEVST